MEKIMKAIMFDFDGTLTQKAPNIWKKIWNELGYNTTDKINSEYYTQLYKYLDHKISYQEWCDQTCKCFMDKQMNKSIMPKLISDIKLMDGFEEFVKTLKQHNISLHIISGNFVEVITQVLGDNVKYFDSINANTLTFDDKGFLTHINGTNYDFEGKADFITEYKQKHNLNTNEICFVGNGDNDEYAHLSGCKTICINPDNTDGSNKTMWHITLDNILNLNDILPELID